jgi:hypothetical protein
MAGTITHEWHGTVLTVTSDSGTSSADLKGAKGDMGVRGAQGAAGSNIDLDKYYTKDEIIVLLERQRQIIAGEIIAFTIDGVIYYSEPNDNFYYWVGSEYNPDGRFVRYNDGTYWRVKDSAKAGTPDIFLGSTRIIANSTISADTAYHTEVIN